MPKNPAWYGFNLLEYFSTDPDWMKYFPYKGDGMFREDDFLWIRDWGFNWVRIPMDYRFWTDANDVMKIYERKVEPIDRAVRLGDKYGVHVNISLHRAPGFCVLDELDPVLTGIHITPEKSSIFSDPTMMEAFIQQWTFFANRYKGIPSDRLSFNLINEAYLPLTAAEKDRVKGGGKEAEEVQRESAARGEKAYVRVADTAIEVIRGIDPQRLIVSDGYATVGPVADLIGTGVVQSPHYYYPGALTHHECEWARGWVEKGGLAPTWPLRDEQGKVIADRRTVQESVRPWHDLERQGVQIHFGEMGCYKHTLPSVVHAWFRDALDAMAELHAGFALWNFRGPFGILDTERIGTKFEDWHGHQLDRRLLKILQEHTSNVP